MGKGHRETANAEDNGQELLDALGKLVDEVHVLREAVDELREEVQYGVRNLLDPEGTMDRPRRITSMPSDPAAPDFAARVNTYHPEDLPAESDTENISCSILIDGQQFAAAVERLGPEVADALACGETVPIEAGRLAEAMNGVEQFVYCCPQPNLEWYGDPDHPGIACANCGFPVAHEGDILCWREPGEEAKPPPEEQNPRDSKQREMF